MFFVKACDLSIIFYAKVQFSTISICKCYNCINDIAIGQFRFVTFKFVRQIFFKTYIGHLIHLPYILYRTRAL